MPNLEHLEVGQWYAAEVIVPSSRSLQGQLMRIIEGDGETVYQFRGRFPWAVPASDILTIEETDPPATGVPRELR